MVELIIKHNLVVNKTDLDSKRLIYSDNLSLNQYGILFWMIKLSINIKGTVQL